MATIKELAQGRKDMYMVDPREIHIKADWNSRDDSDPANVEHIDNLAKSIAEVGVKEPLTCYMEDGKLYVSDGHCRRAGAIRAIEVYKAEIKTVPVKMEDKYSSEAERIMSQLVRNAGKPLSVIEQGKVFKKLLDLGWKAKDIATKGGISASRVSQILELQTMPESVKALVTQGAVSATLAMQTVKAEGAAAPTVLAKAVEAAKADGKEQAMPKHMGEKPAKANVAKTIKEIFETANANGLIDDSEDMVTVSMPESDWETIRNLLKL